MKYFVTGRSSNYSRVNEAFDTIEALGGEVTLRWTDFPIIKPYAQNGEIAGLYATQQIQGLIDADIFILFAHEDGTGVFTEFGAALALAQLNEKLQIFAIGDEIIKSKAMFHYHPLVTWKESLTEVLDEVEK